MNTFFIYTQTIKQQLNKQTIMFNIKEGGESKGSGIQYVQPGINILTLQEIVVVERGGKKMADFIWGNNRGGTIKSSLFSFDFKGDYAKNMQGKANPFDREIEHYETGQKKSIKKGAILSEVDSICLRYAEWQNEIKHIRNRFSKEIPLTGATFDELIKNLITKLTPHFNKTEVKVACTLVNENGKDYTNVKKYIPYLADITDDKTLEALTLNTKKTEVKPDNEQDVPSSNQDSNFDWPKEAPKVEEPKEDDLPF